MRRRSETGYAVPTPAYPKNRRWKWTINPDLHKLMPLVRIGLISDDTHGLLQPEAQMFLQGCDHIIHAGDIGKSDILEALARLAPLTVVRGNNDQGG